MYYPSRKQSFFVTIYYSYTCMEKLYMAVFALPNACNYLNEYVSDLMVIIWYWPVYLSHSLEMKVPILRTSVPRTYLSKFISKPLTKYKRNIIEIS